VPNNRSEEVIGILLTDPSGKTPGIMKLSALFIPESIFPRPTNVDARVEKKSPPCLYCHSKEKDKFLYFKVLINVEVQSALGSPIILRSASVKTDPSAGLITRFPLASLWLANP